MAATLRIAGLDGLSDEPRTIADEQVEAVIVRVLEAQASNTNHRLTDSMAADLGMSQSAISRIWRAFGLKPRLVEQYRLSPDPEFIRRVRGVSGLHVNPSEVAIVV